MIATSTAAGNAGIGSWIERRARAAPAGVALIAGDCSLTYSELADRGRRLANGLRTLGVAKGDRVAWLGPNHPAFLESLFAAGLLGAAMAPVNHRLDQAEPRRPDRNSWPGAESISPPTRSPPS